MSSPCTQQETQQESARQACMNKARLDAMWLELMAAWGTPDAPHFDDMEPEAADSLKKYRPASVSSTEDATPVDESNASLEVVTAEVKVADPERPDKKLRRSARVAAQQK